jgi:predicted nucleic acid-binding protein
MLDSERVFCFIDTNIWLYAFVEADDPRKSSAARSLIQESEPHISTQVINEVCVNLLRKAGFSEERISELIESFYDRYPAIESNKLVLLEASRLRQRYSLSFWDSTIVASALAAGVSHLYSEDSQNGLSVNGRLTVLNPFAAHESG